MKEVVANTVAVHQAKRRQFFRSYRHASPVAGRTSPSIEHSPCKCATQSSCMSDSLFSPWSDLLCCLQVLFLLSLITLPFSLTQNDPSGTVLSYVPRKSLVCEAYSSHFGPMVSVSTVKCRLYWHRLHLPPSLTESHLLNTVCIAVPHKPLVCQTHSFIIWLDATLKILQSACFNSI